MKTEKSVFLGMFFISMFCWQLSSAQEMSLSARLSQPDGSPLEGVVDLRFELSYSNAPESVICTKDLAGTNLTNGLFQLGLNFSSAECGGSSLADVLEGVPTNEAMLFRVVDITDTANPRTYPFQSLKTVPLSVRSEVAQTLARNSAVEGQVLRFVGGQWIASNDTAEIGTVSQINTGDGLVGGPITDSGTIAIANSGVTSVMIADGSLVNADVAGSAAIARSKLALGAANNVLINDGSGVISEVPFLSIANGGTGASSVVGARANLGLGTAALRNVGLLAGELLDSGEIPSCALDEKIRKVVMPVAGFVCESGADATKLPLAGGTMSGSINMNANAITNLADPSLAQDAATKAYVDGQIGGGAANQWSELGGNVYRNTGNVGIGTTTPTNAFHLTERDDSWLSGMRIDRSYDSATDYFQMMYDFEGFKLRTMANDPDEAHIIFKPLNVEALRISENGNVGIGVVNPSSKLDINGQIKIAGGAPGAGKVLTSDASGLASWVAPATSATPIGAASGDLSGNYPSPVIAAGAVTDAKVAAGANISQSKILNLVSDLAGKQPSLGFTPVNKAGDSLTSGVFDFGSSAVLRANNPVGTRDVANKTYVDTQVSGAANQWTASSGNVYRLSGNVGVGTNAPTASLDVAGQIRIRSGLPGAGKVLTSDASGLATWVTPAAGATYNAGVGLSLSGSTFSLTNVGASGTYGSASVVPVITTNAQGQVSAVTNTTIQIPTSSVTSGVFPAARLPALAGDVVGSVGATSVTALRGRSVATTAPATGQVLTYNGSQWVPSTPAGGGANCAAAARTASVYTTGYCSGPRFDAVGASCAAGAHGQIIACSSNTYFQCWNGVFTQSSTTIRNIFEDCAGGG